MRVKLLAAFLLCLPLGAADLSGKWNGTLEFSTPDGDSRSQPMVLVLKQDGAALSGTAGPNLANMRAISKGAIEGDTVAFDLPLGRGMHAQLKWSADRLAGTVSGTGAPGIKLTATKFVARSPESLSAQLGEIDSYIGAQFAKHPIGSVNVGVVSGSRLIWSKSYGDADMEKKIAADADTVYRIGSITKMFTALMLEQLVDAHKVHFSDPVEKYFPEVNKVQGRYPDAAPITLIQLATHTSGLGREPDDLPTYLKGSVADWENVLVAALPHVRYQFEPGTRWFYSNIGFAILGAALSHASGEAYFDYVPKHIFEPLGMTHSALQPDDKMLSHLSKGYQMMPGGKIDTETPQREHAGRGYKVPNGAIYTTVGDLAKFAAFLMGEGPDSVLKSDSLERILAETPVQANSDLESGYGLAYQVERRPNYISFGHDGSVAGYLAALDMNRKAELGVIVLANSTGVNPSALAEKALNTLSK